VSVSPPADLREDPARPDRAAAWDTVCEFTKSDSLRRHMLAVEAAMRAYATKFDEDPELWGAVGLLHDFDYEMHPEAPDHPLKGEPILEGRGWSQQVRRAILSHAHYTGVERESNLEKALHACDDVTGFVVAVALVRPDKDLRTVKLSSLKKKWKDKRFAGGVDRDEVRRAVDDLGVELDEHLRFVLEAMQAQAGPLGLAGEGDATDA
jgi:predicted hydrolase (HD superfamily)